MKWNWLYLDGDLCFERPTGSPNDQAEDGEEQEEDEESDQGLDAPGEGFVAEVVVRALLHDDVTLRPALVVVPVLPPAAALPAGGGAEDAGESAGGGVAGVAAEGGGARRVRWGLHWAVVVNRRRLHRPRRLVSVVVGRLARRALHEVHRTPLRRRPSRRRRRQARHVRFRLRRR